MPRRASGATMAWRKSPARLVAAFDAALPSNPRIERRTMFGCPCAFVNRNMFAGLHQDALFVRLDAEGRERLHGRHRARPFEPMPGRVMREYLVVPERLAGKPRALASVIAKAFEYAAGLPPRRSPAAAPKRVRRPRAGRARGGAAAGRGRPRTRRS